MDRERLAWLRIAAVAGDGLALAAVWTAVVQGRAALRPTGLLHGVRPEEHLPLLLIVVPLWLGVLAVRGAYHRLRRKPPGRAVLELATSSGIATVLLLALLYALKLEYVSRTVVLGFALASVPALGLARAAGLTVLRALRRGRFDPYRVLLVGEPGDASAFVDAVARHDEWGIAVVGTSTPEGVASRLVAEPIDEVFVTSPDVPLAPIAEVCEELGVHLSLHAGLLGVRGGRATLQDYDGVTVLTLSTAPADGARLAAKRAVDVLGASLALLLAAPVLVIAALAIKLEDGGPVFFAQERVGRFGRTFRMLKLRTMVPDAEARLATVRGANEMSGPVFKMRDDPRVTRVGRLLRRTSLDELPQLVHVLTGTMSLVGPRPPLPDEVRRYERRHLRRLSMRPGLTCIWQVSGRNEIDFDRWMALDLEYIDRWSLRLDLELLARTLPAVLRGTGAR